MIFNINLAVCQSYNTDVYTRFVNYTTKDGLINNRINDILQDNRGFMWFATENGLSRFDGYEFINYRNIFDDTLSIPGNTITSLAQDGNENLWIGTTEGLCRLSLKNGTIKRYMAQTENKNTPRTNHIRKLLYIKSNNTLWIETLEGTLTSYHITENNWEHVSHTSVKQSYYRYHTLFHDSNENIWLGGRSTPLMRFDIKNKTIRTINALGFEKESKRDNDIGDIIETKNGEWFVVGLDGIYQFFPETEKFNRIYTTSTYSISEDSDGFVWFGTGNGLVSLNTITKEFSIYRNNQNNALSLINNHVNKVYIDRVGNIWIGTRNGISLLSKKNSHFSYYYNIPNYDLSLSSNSVTSLAQSKEGELYIGTADHGINVWKPDEINFLNYKSNPKEKCAIASDRVSSLYFDRQGTLWVGLWAGVGMNSFDLKSKCFTKYILDPTSLKRDWYNAFVELNDGSFLVGFWGANGATYFDRRKGVFQKHYITFEKPYSRSINQILNDGFGSIFFLSFSSNIIYQYNTKSKEYLAYVSSMNFVNEEEYGIKNNLPFSFDNITCMETDGNGLTLFGTEKGIIGYSLDKGFFQFYNGNLDPISIAIKNSNVYILENKRVLIFNSNAILIYNHSIQGENIDNIKVAEDGSIIVSGDSNLFILKKSKKEFEKTWHVLSPFEAPNRIHHFVLDNKTAWFGTQNGLYCYSIDSLLAGKFSYSQSSKILDSPILSFVMLENGSIICFTPLGLYSNCISSRKVKQIELIAPPNDFNPAMNTATMFGQDTVWVGNENGHFQIVLKKGEVIETNLPGNNRVSSHLVSTLMEDNAGNIWVGTTDRGLNKINRENGNITHFIANSNPYSLQGNKVNSTLQTSDGKIWVATDEGLSYIESDFVFRFDGLINNQEVFSLLEDSQGLLWAATNKGLVSINFNKGELHLFNKSHGIPSIDFSTSSVRLSDGRLAWGTNEGFFLFNPETITKDIEKQEEVFFTKFNIFEKPVRYHFSKNDSIKLHHSQNFFQINFSVADFGLIPGTTFRYRLSKIDPQWVETTSSNASYTNIPPGKYLFEVNTSFNNEATSPNSSKLLIIIPPPFWSTIWFRAFVFLLFLGGVSAYLYTYIRQLKLDRLSVQLEQRLLISQMNPHFIFNSLSAIQSFMYSNNPEEAGNYLSSFSRLVRLILENSRSEFIPINQEIKTLELYLMLQKLRFPDKFEYKIEVSPQVEGIHLMVPPMLAQPFIENSIEHGIMHMNDKGLIIVSIDIIDSIVSITIEDNGIGIEKSKEINKQKRLTHTSYATSITSERIKSISSSRKANLGISIIDLNTEGKEGTRVVLRFPVKVIDQ
jgi:ligand-binding sensor domain-containing protein